MEDLKVGNRISGLQTRPFLCRRRHECPKQQRTDLETLMEKLEVGMHIVGARGLMSTLLSNVICVPSSEQPT